MCPIIGLSGQNGHEGTALHALGDFQPRRFQQRWRQVQELHQGVADAAGLYGSRHGDDQRHPDQAFIEATPLQDQTVIPECLPVVRREDDKRVFPLAVFIKPVQHAPHVLIHQFDHGVVGRMNLLAVEFVRMLRRSLKIDTGQPGLGLQIRIPEPGARQPILVEPRPVVGRRIKRRMGIEHVDRHQPRAVPLLGHELQRPIRAERGLVVLGRDWFRRRMQFAQVGALFAAPAPVGMILAPFVPWRVAPLEHPVPIVPGPRLRSLAGTGQMKLARQAAVVTGSVPQCDRHQLRGFRPQVVAVATAMDRARVEPGQEAGTAGGTDGALAEGQIKGRTLGTQPVQVRRMHMGVAQGTDGVEPLLVRANPENVGS